MRNLWNCYFFFVGTKKLVLVVISNLMGILSWRRAVLHDSPSKIKMISSICGDFAKSFLRERTGPQGPKTPFRYINKVILQDCFNLIYQIGLETGFNEFINNLIVTNSLLNKITCLYSMDLLLSWWLYKCYDLQSIWFLFWYV